MQRIALTDDGITVTHVTADQLSAFGTVVRPGHTAVYDLPWNEVFVVSLTGTAWYPDRDVQVTLEIDVIWGETFEVRPDATGFTEALHELCRRSGTPVPALSLEDGQRVEVWHLMEDDD